MAHKKTIPYAVRLAVLRAAGAIPGEQVNLTCHWCAGHAGTAYGSWRRDGKPSTWISTRGVELDHVIPEAHGGQATIENLVVSCRRCNRSKGTQAYPLYLTRGAA